MSKVLISGAGGFIGANVVEILAERGLDCLGLDIRRGVLDRRFPLVEGDILDESHLDRILNGTEGIVHLAVSNLRTSIENPKRNVRINVEGTLNLLEAARKHKARKFVYSSASSVYGVPQYTPVDEEHPKLPKTIYGITKYMGEHLVRVYHELHGIDCFIFRFTNVYGPKQHPATGGLIPTVLTRMHEGKPVFVFGDGMQTRDFVFVEDVVRFVARAVEESDKTHETVNLGSGIQTAIIDVIKLCADILGVEPIIEYKQQEIGERKVFQTDMSRCSKIFGEVPNTPLREGLRKTAEWLSTHVWDRQAE
ncbi:MAG: NAD-dependent epimerase/dehydratase family protein [Candidatus Bipolaricaulia bacterium]